MHRFDDAAKHDADFALKAESRLNLRKVALPLRAEIQYPLTVTDSLGRTVTIPAEPKAVLLGSGFNLVAISLIHPNPVSILAGWANDMKGDNPEIYARFKDKFPKIEEVPIIGDGITIPFEAADEFEVNTPSGTPREVSPGRQVKVGRNDPCPCGSGQKFKRCHGGPM